MTVTNPTTQSINILDLAEAARLDDLVVTVQVDCPICGCLMFVLLDRAGEKPAPICVSCQVGDDWPEECFAEDEDE